MYTGVDKENYNRDSRDKIDRLFLIDIEEENISKLIEGKFDIVYFSHVIEHLNNGFDILKQIRFLQNPRGNFVCEKSIHQKFKVA